MKTVLLILTAILSFSNKASSEDKTLPQESIYQITSKWKDQNDKTISLRTFAGKPVIITMVYTGCNHSCPMTIAKVQDIKQAMESKGLDKHQIVLASFDTAKDKPEYLKKYMKTRGLNEDKWTFLSTSDEKVARELAVVLGISYKSIGNGDFSHSNVITYLDANGVIKNKIESLNADIEPILQSAKEELMKDTKDTKFPKTSN